MAIIRSERRKNFTHIDNKVFADNVLSFRAMGLLGYLLSKPDNWSVSARHLATVTEKTARPVAINAVHETLKELRQAGFIVMKKRHTGETDYFVFDEPQKPDVEMPNQEKPNQEKPNQPKPDDENPNQEKPNQEKPDVLTITESKQELNIKQELSCDPLCAFASETAPTADVDLIEDGQPENPVAIVADPQPEILPADKPKKPDPRSNPDNVKTWEAYARAYRARYGVLPMSNAKVRGQVAQFVKTVGAELAPVLAAYYPSHNKQYFVQRRHDFGALLHDYQQVATDYQIGQQMTGVQAAQAEKTQANRSSHDEALAILRAKGLA